METWIVYNISDKKATLWQKEGNLRTPYSISFPTNKYISFDDMYRNRSFITIKEMEQMVSELVRC